MTRTTTITEYSSGTTSYVNVTNSQGLSGGIVFKDDEAIITIRGGADCIEYNIHPEDAMADFLSYFFDYQKPYQNEK